MTDAIKEKLAKHKWQEPPIHPVNNLPLMTDDAIKELANDIKKNGLQEPIILWRDNRDEANGSTGPFPVFLLDGRNRLAALKLLGVKDPTKATYGSIVGTTVRTLNAIRQITTIGGKAGMSARWETDCDPLALHISLNVHRRHLTAKQKRKAIEAMLNADPQASDRAIARKLKVDHETVGNVRKKLGGGNRQSKKHNKKQRLEKAFAVLAKLDLTVDDLAEHTGHRLIPIERE